MIHYSNSLTFYYLESIHYSYQLETPKTHDALWAFLSKNQDFLGKFIDPCSILWCHFWTDWARELGLVLNWSKLHMEMRNVIKLRWKRNSLAIKDGFATQRVNFSLNPVQCLGFWTTLCIGKYLKFKVFNLHHFTFISRPSAAF